MGSDIILSEKRIRKAPLSGVLNQILLCMPVLKRDYGSYNTITAISN